MRSNPERLKALFAALAVVAAAALAYLIPSPTVLDAAVYFFYFLMLAASWNLLAGFCGQMSFAHMAFCVTGAYVAASTANVFGLPMAAAVVVGALAAACGGFLVGIFTLRFRDITFSLATFAFAGVLTSWLIGASDITGGSNGMSAPPIFPGDQARAFVWLGLALSVVFFALQWLLLSSRWGILMRAVRDREPVARGLGVKATQLKVTVFAYTAFWAGLAGGYFAAYTEYVTPTMAGLENMGLVLGMVIVGGIGTVAGPVLGTLVFRFIDFFTRGYGGEYTVFAFALILLVTMLFLRDGAMGLITATLRRIRAPQDRWSARQPASVPGTTPEP